MKEYPSPIHQSTLYIMEELFEEHKTRFLTYVEPFCTVSDENVASQSIYKKEHTLRVVEFARMLAMDSSQFFIYYPILLSALYHDIGRFQQYLQFKTHKDTDSCNHGHLGVKIAKQQAFLHCESQQIQQYVYTAIALHNIYTLPQLPSHIEILVKLIRDADRLDIFHKLSHTLSSTEEESSHSLRIYAKDIPDAYNPKVLLSLQNKEMVLYSDILYHNDLRLMLFSWYCNFSTKYAMEYIQKSYLLEGLYQRLPKIKEIDDICIPLLS
ncbi:MAG: HD domain-containing protein [Desulfovibrionaceae bacterium]